MTPVDSICLFLVKTLASLAAVSIVGSHTWGLNSLEYLRGTLEMRRHFETPCGSYMGGDTLESMQQWRPSNLTVDATISPEDIRGTGDLCCHLYHICIFLN